MPKTKIPKKLLWIAGIVFLSIISFRIYQYVSYRYALGQYRLAQMFLEEGDLTAAEAVLKSAVMRDQNFGRAYRLLGAIYERLENPEEALVAYQRYSKSILPVTSRMVNARIQSISRLIKQNTRAAKLYSMALSYQNSGDVNEALDWFDTIIEDYPESGVYTEALVQGWCLRASRIYNYWRKSTERLAKSRDLLKQADDFSFFSQDVLRLMSLSEKSRKQSERYALDMDKEIDLFIDIHTRLMREIVDPAGFSPEIKPLTRKGDFVLEKSNDTEQIVHAYNTHIIPFVRKSGGPWARMNLLSAYIILRSESKYDRAVESIMRIIEADYLSDDSGIKLEAQKLYELL